MKAPLRLDNYFFSRIEVQANKGFDPQTKIESHQLQLKVDMGFSTHRDDPGKIQIKLAIHDLNAGDTDLPYDISIEIIGFFTIDPEFKHNDPNKVAKVNGASLLYSSAREMVLGLTSRGPWPPLMLPTINFMDRVSKSNAVPPTEVEDKACE